MSVSRKPSTVGDVLLYEFLIPYELKINDLADMLNVHRNSVSALVNNNRNLSLDMAIRLSRLFGTSVEFWLNIQLKLDLWKANNDARLADEVDGIQPIEHHLEIRNKRAA